MFRKTNGGPYEKALVSNLNDRVTAELFFDGLNVVLSPSRHKNGYVYQWETYGPIPSVAWVDLQNWFGFEDPVGMMKNKTYSFSQAERPYWCKYKGDLRSLDLPMLFSTLDLRCELLNADEEKYVVECPWRNNHSDKENAWTSSDTSTVIWCAKHSAPTFKCLHAHCDEKSLEQVLSYAELRGVGVDDHCSAMRVWSVGPDF